MIKDSIYNIDNIISYIVKYDEGLSMNDMLDSDMTKMKLQKILYYAQGHYLAKFETKLFNNAIFAWTHGPVVRDVYDDFSECEYNQIVEKVINSNDKYNSDIIFKNQKDKDFLDNLMMYYSQFSPWGLRQMTHNENNCNNPWTKTKKDEEISIDLILDFFKKIEDTNRCF